MKRITKVFVFALHHVRPAKMGSYTHMGRLPAGRSGGLPQVPCIRRQYPYSRYKRYLHTAFCEYPKDSIHVSTSHNAPAGSDRARTTVNPPNRNFRSRTVPVPAVGRDHGPGPDPVPTSGRDHGPRSSRSALGPDAGPSPKVDHVCLGLTPRYMYGATVDTRPV